MAVERMVTLDVDELTETLRVLREQGHGKAGGDYEPECPICTAADKIDAALGVRAPHPAHCQSCGACPPQHHTGCNAGVGIPQPGEEKKQGGQEG